MSKVHFEDSSVLENAPFDVIREYAEQDMAGALCGYVRKNTTYDEEKVTCFYCKKALERGERLYTPR